VSMSPLTAFLGLALAGGTVNAPEEPRRLPDCDTAQQRVELPAEPRGEVAEVCISPGLATTFLFFQGGILRDRVVVEDAQRFTWVEAGTGNIVVLPSENVAPGQRLKLTVFFAGSEAPASATFTLVVHPARAARQVEVFRQKRTLASYQQSEKEKEAQVQQCRAENARLRAESEGPRGLVGLLATGVMDEKGVPSRDLSKSATRHPANALTAVQVFSYHSSGRVAVELWLEDPKGGTPWRVAGAELVGPGHRRLRVLPPWQEETRGFAAESFRVVIEAEATEQEARGSFTLKAWNEEGTRSLILSGVTFP
jgi:uncharacterized protein (TIGR02268 family)